MKLTKSEIDSLPDTKKDQFYWDNELKGFGLRVSPRGKKTFVVQYRHAGRTQRFRIGHYGKLTVHEARRDAKIMLGEIARGKSPAKYIGEGRNSPTLETVAKRFMTEHVAIRLKPTTQSDYKHNLNTNILPALGARKIADITHKDVQELHLKMKDTPTQANRTISVLSKIFNLCEKWGLRDGATNPCTQIERYKEKSRHRFLDETELKRLWAALDAFKNESQISEYAITAFKLLILTGCRLGEIRTLKWDYIKGNRVEFPDTKTGFKRLPLNAEAMQILRDTPKLDNNDYVICGAVAGKPIVNLQKSWRRIRARAGLEDVRIHDLRHTFASHAVMGGTPLAVVSKLLGHSQIATTMRYAHLADKELLQASEGIGSMLKKANPHSVNTDNIHYLKR